MTGERNMPKKRKPHEERKPEDYREAADNALELAKVLAGQGGISDQDFLERMARSDELVEGEKSKFFKLWEKEKKAGRDPRKAFKDRGWEP
jgi:hypothetical protein